MKSSLESPDKLKTPQTYVVNNSNVWEIFGGENDTLGDYINEGDTLDIHGTFFFFFPIRINTSVNF